MEGKNKIYFIVTTQTQTYGFSKKPTKAELIELSKRLEKYETKMRCFEVDK